MARSTYYFEISRNDVVAERNKEVLEEIFLTGVCIDDLEYLKINVQRWNKNKKCWSCNKRENFIVYQKSKEDIDRWYLRNEKKQKICNKDNKFYSHIYVFNMGNMLSKCNNFLNEY